MPKPRGEIRRRRVIAGLQWLVGIGAFAGVVWYVVPTWSSVLDQVRIAPSALVVAFLSVGVIHLIVALRWKMLTEAMSGTPLSLWAYLHSLLLTRFLAQFAPALAMDLVGRGVALKSAGSERGLGHTATLVILERILDVVAPVVLLVWAFGVRALELEHVALPLLGAGVLLFIVGATALMGPLAKLGMWAYGRLRRADVGELRIDLDGGLAFRIVLLSVARFTFVLVQFGAIGAGVGVVLPWLSWVAATPLAQISGMVGLTPGGLGVVEAGWWAGLAWVGVGRDRIALFLLAQRAMLVSFLGLLTLVVWPVARGVTRESRARA